MDPLAESDPRQLGPYKIIARLGSGGMGVVFLGSRGSARVAVKVMRSSFLDSPALKTRFVREIETLKKIKSPFVAQYLDSDAEGDLVWHAVEFINGPTLKEKIDNDGPLSEEGWWTLYSQMCEALADVHRLGLVHRDLKPANIILSETGLKLIDFGIAQDAEATSLTQTGIVAGSPAWLSPEQLEGAEVGPGSDLFAAGSILTYAALGRSPWGNETTMTVPVAYKRILNRDFDLDGLPHAYKEAISPLFLEKASQRSFLAESAPLGGETLLEISEERSEDHEIDERIVNREAPQVEHLSSGARVPKRRLLLALTSLVITAVVAGGIALISSSPPLEPETVDIGEFGLEIKSDDSPRWVGDDRGAWVDVLMQSKSNLAVESVSLKFYDSDGRDLFTTGEYFPDDMCDSSRGMVLSDTSARSGWSFSGKCLIDKKVEPESLFRVQITFADRAPEIRLEFVDRFLNGMGWLSDERVSSTVEPEANSIETGQSSISQCKKPTISDNFRLSRSSGDNLVEILVRPLANIATCVGGVEKVVVRVSDLREKPPGYRFYGRSWTQETCLTGAYINGSEQTQFSPTHSIFELAPVGSDKFELVCTDEGALEPWPLEITYVITFGNFEYPVEYLAGAELGAFRD